MGLPHRAPIGALRTQAGVKRSETPVKRSHQQNRVPKERQKFCRPYRGLQYAHASYAGVKRSETPVKRSRQQNRVPTVRQKFCRPYRGFNLFIHPMQGFRFAAPPASVLSPLSGLAICSYILCRGSASLHHLPVFCRPYRGLQYTHTSFAGVPIRCTTCLCSVRPYRGFNMLMHPLQGFRYAPPPACVLNAPIGACNLLIHPMQGFRFALPLPVILTPLSGLAITIRINMMTMSMLFPYELRIMNCEL